jgi:hypothetical protein
MRKKQYDIDDKKVVGYRVGTFRRYMTWEGRKNFNFFDLSTILGKELLPRHWRVR